VPVIDQYMRDSVEAKADAASWKARYDEAVKQGYAPAPPAAAAAAASATTAAAAAPAGFDAKANRVITYDDMNRVIDATGMADAMIADLQEEYHLLTGGRLIDYTMTTSDGRMLRGMTALRAEAQGKKVPIDRYIAEKFDFAGKRTAADAKRKLEAENAIRADERASD